MKQSIISFHTPLPQSLCYVYDLDEQVIILKERNENEVFKFVCKGVGCINEPFTYNPRNSMFPDFPSGRTSVI